LDLTFSAPFFGVAIEKSHQWPPLQSFWKTSFFGHFRLFLFGPLLLGQRKTMPKKKWQLVTPKIQGVSSVSSFGVSHIWGF
jgi:hypothetical protein